MKHTIFFDGECPLCQYAIGKIKGLDTQEIFECFPLQSAKAKELLPDELLSANTLVLLGDQGALWIRARAVLHILHLLKPKAKWPLWLCHVPGIDLFYRSIAHNRRFFDRFFL